MPRLTLALGVLALQLSAGCGGSEPSGPVPTTLVVEPTTPRLLVGTLQQLHVEVLDADGQAIPDLPVTYSVSAESPFSVSSEGQIAAADAPGNGTITVESAGLHEDVSVEVFAPTHPTGILAATTGTGGSPWQAAVSPTGLVLVRGGPQAIVLQGLLPSFDLTATNPPFIADRAIAISPQGTRIFNARDPALNGVGMRDASTFNIFRALTCFGGEIVGMIAGNEEEVAYLATDASCIAKADFTQPEVIGLASAVPWGPMALRPGSPAFYLVGSVGSLGAAPALIEMDPNQPTHRIIELTGTPEQLAASKTPGLVYVTNDGPTVQVVDLGPGSIESIDIGCDGFGIAITPDEAQLYVSCPGTGEIKIIDVASRAVVNTLQVGGTPRLIAISPDGTTAVIPNSGGSVYFIR
jgi:YVTN family beta-propeller protein